MMISAIGQSEMLLQRWRNYVDNGYGGNKELKDMVERYNSGVDEKYILERES